MIKGSKHSAETRRKMSVAKKGERHPRWRGGKYRDETGRIRILLPDHPCANHQGYVLEHRLVMEAHLGRTLLPTEVVHHINGVVDDNRIENLALFPSLGRHAAHHNAERKRRII